MAKRTLALLLALLLTGSMVGFSLAEEEIKWSGSISVAPYMMGPIVDDQVTPLIEEALLDYGYDVELENVYIENNDYANLLNLRIASDDAPDIFKVDTDVMLDRYYEQGVIAAWDEEFFRENAPDVAAFIDAGNPLGTNANIVDATWAMCKRDGEMCAVPLISQNTGSQINVIYNTQWLENLGAEVPETLDEFIDLMYRFTFEDPDGNGVDDTYGMSASMIGPIFGAYGSWTGYMGFDTGFWYDVDGELVSCDVMPHNKEALALVKQLYDDGVLDPEFITGENQGGYWAISHSFVNGRIGVTHTARMTHYTPANLYDTGNNPGTVLVEFQAVQGPDASVTIGPWPEGPYGDRGGFLRYTNSINGATVYNINVDEEKLAALFQIMNIFATDFELAELAYHGIEGVHFERAGDEFNTRVSLIPADEQTIAYGVGAMRGIYGPESPLNEELHEYNSKSATSVWMDEIYSQYEGLTPMVGYVNKLWTSLPSQAQYQAELITYRDETWTKIIQCTLDIDDYDTYVEEWMNRGGATLTEEANEWYDING